MALLVHCVGHIFPYENELAGHSEGISKSKMSLVSLCYHTDFRSRILSYSYIVFVQTEGLRNMSLSEQAGFR